MLVNEVLDKRLNKMETRVSFCTKCVNSNQRFGFKFDKNGICDACNYSIKKDKEINWKKREKELQILCDKYRSKDGGIDCIVPASGGKDSLYVAHQLKYQYDMNPLTATFAPASFTDIGWKNYQNMCKKFDNIMCYPSRDYHSKLARLGLELLGDIFTPWHMGSKSFPMKVAIKYKVPLIFYGENQGAEYGGRTDNEESPFLDEEERNHDKSLHEKNLKRLVRIGSKYGVFPKNGIRNKSLEMYTLPEESEIKKLNLIIPWFSFYKKWIPQENYYYAHEHCGFELNPERSEGTFSKYSSLDDKTDGLYFYFMLLKLGTGRCTSDASQEIRSGLLTREEAVALVHKFDTEFPKKYFKENLEYLGIKDSYFLKIIEKFRSKHLWEKIDGDWQLKFKVT